MGRRLAHVLVAVGLVGAACTGGGPSRPGGDGDGGVPGASFAEIACSLPLKHVVRIRQGYDPERSGDIQLAAAPRVNFGSAHSGPEAFLQRVPLFLYGPGHVSEAGRVGTPTTMVDLAPTLAQHLRFPFDAPDGEAVAEASPVGDDPPRLVVGLVWDGGGRNVLARWPGAWGFLRSLIPQGVWLDRHTVGFSPSVTPPVHATMATGAFPDRHGVVELVMQLDGEWRPGGDSRFLRIPTLGDLYDRSLDNAPLVAHIGNLFTIPMLGRGSLLAGGDRDILAIHDIEGTWSGGPNPEGYRTPGYLDTVPGLEERVQQLDLEDGEQDGRWLGEPMGEEWGDLAAFTGYQMDVTEELIRREGLGADDVPDLLLLNVKQIDRASHRWGLESPQMEAAVRAADDGLRALLDVLDREVGAGEWMLALTADHGSARDPEASGTFDASREEFMRDLERRFGGEEEVIQRFRPTQLWLDREVLERNGSSVEDVARYLAGYRRADATRDPDALPADQRDAPVFAAVFPSELLRDLPCLG